MRSLLDRSLRRTHPLPRGGTDCVQAEIRSGIVKKTIALVLTTLIALSVVGQVPNEAIKKREGAQPPVPAPAQTGTHEMTAIDVEAFLDGLVPLQIKQADIAGATISVVKDGK